jgi:hypothetical protein
MILSICVEGGCGRLVGTCLSLVKRKNLGQIGKVSSDGAEREMGREEERDLSDTSIFILADQRRVIFELTLSFSPSI